MYRESRVSTTKLLVVASLLVIELSGQVRAAWTFTAPPVNHEYTTTAAVSASGSGAPQNNTVFILECQDFFGVCENSTNGTSMMGMWAGTITAPSSGWSVDGAGENHKIEVFANGASQGTRAILIK